MLVSIIIPVYNSEKHIKRCLDSVLSQSYNDLEIIIINDGSTDNSEQIINELCANDKRAKLFTIKNGGVSNARNYGISKASGDYLMFIDSDDFISSTYIKNYLSNYNNEDLIIGGYSYYFENDKRIIPFKCKNSHYIIDSFMKDIEFFLRPPYLLGPCFKLYKKSIIISNNIFFPLDISYGEDAEFVYSYLNHCFNIVSIENDGYFYCKSNEEQTLSTVFLENKIDIYHRLSLCLTDLLLKHRVGNCDAIVNKLFSINFIGYCHELFASSKTFSQKKSIFFAKAMLFDIKNILKRNKDKTKAMSCVLLSLKTRIFWPTYLMFKLYDSKKNK